MAPDSDAWDKMLPPQAPSVVNGDFDPSQPLDDEDVEMRSETDEPKVELSAVEINILIYLYLLESNFSHSAFSLLSESNLAQTSLFQHFNPTYPSSKPSSSKGMANGGAQGKASPATSTFGNPNGRIERGELVRKLWKALRWEEIERHVGDNGEPYTQTCPNPFHLLIPHTCPDHLASAINNPPKAFPTLRVTPPPERPEAFPPPEMPEPEPETELPEQPTAGPSRRKDNSNKGKRRSRRNSDTSTLPTRSASPATVTATATATLRKRKVEEGEDEEMAEDNTSTVETASVLSSKTRKQGNRRAAAGAAAAAAAAPAAAGGNNDRLSATPMAKSRSKSPVKKDAADSLLKSAEDKGEGNPRWIKQTDVGMFNAHRDIVNCVAWNPTNSGRLASVSNDSTARFWDLSPSTIPGHRALTLEDKEPLMISHKSIDANKKAITALSWHPEGTLLGTAAADGVGRLFTPNGALEGILSYGRKRVNAIKFSPDGSKVLTVSDERAVNLFKVTHSGPALQKTFDAHTAEVNDVDWMDDEFFASGGNDHKVFVYQIGDARPQYRCVRHTDDVTRIKWAPLAVDSAEGSGAGRHLASVSDDGSLCVWLINRESNRDGDDNEESDLLEERPMGNVDHLVARWQVVESSESENKRMDALAWCNDRPDGKFIVAAGGQDSTIKIYDVTSVSHIHTLDGFELGTGSLTFSPPGFFGAGAGWGAIAGGSWNATFKIWDVETGEVLKEYDMEEDESKQRSRKVPFFTSVAWKPDGEHIAASLSNKAVMTFFVGDLRRAATAPDATRAIADVAEGEGDESHIEVSA